ncbi:MAG: methionyl-tRNA formyltransferase [Acidothermaceae bacterium]
MRVVFAGTPAVALPSFDAVLSSAHQLIAAVSRPDAAAGRGRRESASPIARRAETAGLEVLKPARPSDPDFQQRLRELAPDVVVVVAYGALVPVPALQIPKHGWVNLHFSLLPAWRGAAPVQHAILHGDEITGATTFVLEAGLDTGPVLGVFTEEIRPRDTAGELLGRLSTAGAGLLVATLDGLASGDLRAVPQPSDGVSLAPKITTADARVDWSRPAMHIDRAVRACTPAPGAWTTLRDRRIKLGAVTSSDLEALPAGEVRVTGDGVAVGTGSRPVMLGTVQPEGKAPMAAGDWARGARLAPGERFA